MAEEPSSVLALSKLRGTSPLLVPLSLEVVDEGSLGDSVLHLGIVSLGLDEFLNLSSNLGEISLGSNSRSVGDVSCGSSDVLSHFSSRLNPSGSLWSIPADGFLRNLFDSSDDFAGST